MPIPAGVMARSLLQVYQLTRMGLLPVQTQATGNPTDGHICANDGMTFLEIQNTAAAIGTVSITVPDTVDANLLVADRTFHIPASSSFNLTGTFPVAIYGPQLFIDVSATTLKLRAYTTLTT